jgi:hypothetical protein
LAPYVSGTNSGWIKVKTRTWREANGERYNLFEKVGPRWFLLGTRRLVHSRATHQRDVFALFLQLAAKRFGSFHADRIRGFFVEAK